MSDSKEEKKRQDQFPWSRSKFHSEYNYYLAKYKVESCLENSRGISLLDLACGDGMMTQIFSEHFSTVVGVDASANHIKEARKRCPNVTFHESLIEDLNLDSKFDSIFLLDILEHVQDPTALLKKAASHLNDDGVMIIHVPNANAVNRKIAVKMGTLLECTELTPFDIDIAGHRRSYTMDTLTQDVASSGLKVIKTGGIFYKILSTAQMDWFLKNGLWQSGEFGWGRVGGEMKDWKEEFCRACYEYGKEAPEDCNLIYAVAEK